MIARSSSLLAALVLLGSSITASTQEAAQKVQRETPSFWYCFKIEGRNETAATLPLDPENLAAKLAEDGFVRLDNAREFNGAGQWNIPDAPFTGVLYVRAQLIQTFVPLTGPPKDFGGKEPNQQH